MMRVDICIRRWSPNIKNLIRYGLVENTSQPSDLPRETT